MLASSSLIAVAFRFYPAFATHSYQQQAETRVSSPLPSILENQGKGLRNQRERGNNMSGYAYPQGGGMNGDGMTPQQVRTIWDVQIFLRDRRLFIVQIIFYHM
jgi:hypothetical protein